MSSKTALLVIFAIIIIVPALLVANWIRHKRIIYKEAQKTGHPFKGAEPIVSALERYMIHHGTAPDQLSRLVPDFVQEVPEPEWGTNEWSYKPSPSGDSYDLSVRLYEDYYAAQYYIRDKNTWWFDN